MRERHNSSYTTDHLLKFKTSMLIIGLYTILTLSISQYARVQLHLVTDMIGHYCRVTVIRPRRTYSVIGLFLQVEFRSGLSVFLSVGQSVGNERVIVEKRLTRSVCRLWWRVWVWFEEQHIRCRSRYCLCMEGAFFFWGGW